MTTTELPELESVVRRGLTLEEFLRLPEDKPAMEYEAGEARQKVSPKARHSRIQGRFVELVNATSVQRRLALAMAELRCTFGGRSYVPDVAVLRWERLPRTPDGRLADDVFEPPDIAVEVISPGQSINRLIRRCLWYIANGVPAALILDPDDESVVLFRPGVSPTALRGEQSLDLGDIVPGLQFTAAHLFAALRLD